MSKHVMVDLETLGISSSPVVISIGAVEFDTETNKLGREFYITVDPESCVMVGMELSASTVMWWMKQDVAAKAAFRDGGVAVNEALLKFSAWYEGGSVWGNGATADNVWLSNAYKLCGVKQPWSYRDDRCYRTLRAVYPDVEADIRGGVFHNALDDAKYQAYHAMKIASIKGLKL